MKVPFFISLLILGAASYPQNGIQDNFLWKGAEKEPPLDHYKNYNTPWNNGVYASRREPTGANKKTPTYLKEEEYELNNIIDDRKPLEYQLKEIESEKPSLTLPLRVYKEIMYLKPSQLMSLPALMKAVVKPVLKSNEFQFFAKYIDETLKAFIRDPELKSMIKEGVERAQAIYEITDERFFKQLVTWFISQYSDEKTARSLSNLLSDMEPVLNTWLIAPMKKYYKSYVTPAVSLLSNNLKHIIGEDEVDEQLAKSNSWWSLVEMYLMRLSQMTTEARKTLDRTARFLKQQDEQLKQQENQ